MSSDSTDSGSDGADASTRACLTKKSIGKVPRQSRKSAREKQKRDHMNELFSDLGKALDLDHPNNGKASVLRESMRILRELINEVDCLNKEHVTLSSEYHYITSERNELLEERSALDAEIKSLQGEIDERTNLSSSDICQTQTYSTAQPPLESHVAFPFISHASESSNSVITPPYFMPLVQEAQGYLVTYHATDDGVPEAEVPCKPQPRYPSSSDSWSCHILNR